MPAPHMLMMMFAAVAATMAACQYAPSGDAAAPRSLDSPAFRDWEQALTSPLSIVTLRESSEKVRSLGAMNVLALESAFSVSSAQIRYTYDAVGPAFAAALTPEQVQRLRADPAVQSIEFEKPMTAFGAGGPPKSWGLDRIDQRRLPLDESFKVSESASPTIVYVIDTGIRGSHHEFAGRLDDGHSVFDDTSKGKVDCAGHGTHVAGTVAGASVGVARDVKIVPVAVLDCAGYGTDATVAAGVDWVAKYAPRGAIANLSLGGGPSDFLDKAVRRLVARGVTVVVAAGNDAKNACSVSPARVPEAITVASTDRTDRQSSFSNFGPCVDIYAPGRGILSASHLADDQHRPDDGTSMAAPHVAGFAARIATPDKSPAATTSEIIARATEGVVTNIGAGSPNRLLYTLQ